MVIDKIIDESFLKSDVTEFALGYDRVKNHTWYDNLNYLVDLSKKYFNDDDFIMDYSCGTGIFPERLLKSTVSCPRILMMDSSPKYLKLSYDKFGNNYKFFFRLMKYLKEENRLQTIDESMGEDYKELLNGIICTNAIHLYPTISDTIKSWNKLLVKGGKLLINSGNIYNPLMGADTKLIDQTVNEISKLSFDIVKENPKYSKYIDLMEDFEYVNKHNTLRDKYFLPIRPINFYTDELIENGFKIVEVKTIDVGAKVDEWFDFLKVYHEGVLGWIGGVNKITGVDPKENEVQDRIDIIKLALNKMFNNKNDFKACWNYIICEKL
jgi:ubiquinone/menaquinone biosynthesis C-methylase UbiE